MEMERMKIYCFSDTHQKHRELNIPEVDMIIFCGDMSNNYNLIKNTIECRDFLEWYSSLPIKNKLLIPGNHDRSIEHKWILPKEYPKINWFFNETKTIEGIKIFGSPYSPVYGDWSYVYSRIDAHKYWNSIEEGTDIIFTHGPSKGILDLAEDYDDRSNIVRVGCKTLATKIGLVKPKLHLFGHIHSCRRNGLYNNGVYYSGGTIFVNCSCLDHGDNSLSSGYIFDYVNGKFSLLV
jgi:Icc-related predicted phosphoesterase